jgi:hypothetical protein
MEMPKAFVEQYGPKIHDHIKREHPDMSDDDRKAATVDALKVSWPKLSPQKQAEFGPKAAKVDNDKLFESVFGGKGGSIVPDVDGWLDGILDL